MDSSSHYLDIFYSIGERDQAYQEPAQLREFNADLEGYKKTMGQQIEQTNKKLAEQLQTIHRLNRDKDRMDQEIFELEEGGRAILDLVQPVLPSQHDSRSIAKRLKDVLEWLKTFWEKKSTRG